MSEVALLPISLVVLTYNEEVNLRRCLESLRGRTDELFVVDSYSTDATEQIAREYTDHFYQNRYESHPAQWQWALNNLPLRHPWVFAIDADWLVSEPLWDELSRILPALDAKINGIYVRHKEVFRKRFIRHGSMYPRYWLRIFKPGAVFIDEHDLVDLHFYVKGDVVRVEFDVVEENAKEGNLEFWVTKQVRFAQRAAVEELRRKRSAELSPVRPALFGTPDQRTLWLKSRWYFLPLYWRSVGYFMYRYFLRLGFLDGREGFVYHFTQALVYRVMVDARIEELLTGASVADDISAYARPLGERQ